LVEDKRVRLELDVGERDRYGRVLAYVYVGDVFVNAWLVANGYAQVMTVPPNVKYADLFVKLEQDAREAAKGLWGIPKDRTEEAEEGYWASSRSNKFHWSSCRWARKISPRNLVVFENREEALKADYIPCKECKP
jgi:micrococcal nuclease